MPFQLGDKVTVRQGWTGFVTELIGGPGHGGNAAYRIQSPRSGDHNRGQLTLQEPDITAGPLTAPTFAVGKKITISGRGGTITANNAELYDVDFEVKVNKHLTVTKQHKIPWWRIALDNTAGD